MPASKPQFSNPTVRPAPSGPEPTISPEVQEDLPKPGGGRVSYGSPFGHFTLTNTLSMDRLSCRAAQTRAPLGPISITTAVQTPGQLLLYTGKADSQSLDSVLLSRQSFFSQLCVSAWNGHIQGTGGGPNCRTWSILRWFPKPGLPKPVRGRQEPDCWGFSVLEASEAKDTDNDSLLLLRQLLLSHISKMRYKGPGLPCASWNTQRIPSCARPVPVPIDAPPYGGLKPFRNGAGRWASP